MVPFIFRLAWLIPAIPYLAALLIGSGPKVSVLIRTRRTPSGRKRKLTFVQAPALVAIAGMAFALLLSLAVLWGTVAQPGVHEPLSVAWFSLGTEVMQVGIHVDPTAALMLVMVTLVCLIAFIYSVSYIRDEPRARRFFITALFSAGAVLGVLVTDNLLVLFLFWQLLGVGSYLLTDLWRERREAQRSVLRRFIVTRVGDSMLLFGLALLYAEVGSLAYRDLFSAATVARLATTPYLGPLSVATVAALMLLGGTIGKSAPLPPHIRLPGAPEGATPVAALIHGATTVSAGAYLMIRAFPLLTQSGAMAVIALVGTAMALYGALRAAVQSNIERLLAFSTMSQLGFVLAALGIGAYAAGLFQLIMHAFFKALLSMAAGSIMQGLERGHRHTSGHAVPLHVKRERIDAADMLKMGGLAFRMPLTAISFLAGSLALSSLPLASAGFWSLGEISGGLWSTLLPPAWALALAAGLTAFSAMRPVALIFLTAPRSRAATYARENKLAMTLPMGVWALLATGLGWLGIPRGFPLLGRLSPNWFGPFVSTSLGEGLERIVPMTLAWQPAIVGVLLTLGGLAAGWWLYGRKSLSIQGDATVDPLHAALDRMGLPRLGESLLGKFGLADRAGALGTLTLRAAVGLEGLIEGGVLSLALIGRGLSELCGLIAGGWVGRGLQSLASPPAVRDRDVRRLQRRGVENHLWTTFVVVALLIAILVLFQRV